MNELLTNLCKMDEALDELEMKDIEGYEGQYAVTRDGRVWSYKSNRFLTNTNNGQGYLQVTLSIGGVNKKYRIHRLVAEAFIPNPEGKPQVDHIDQDKSNNCVENLRWATGSENITNGYKHREKYYSPVRCVELNREFNKLKDAAEALGINRQNITNCLAGKQQTAGGYHWERIEED